MCFCCLNVRELNQYWLAGKFTNNTSAYPGEGLWFGTGIEISLLILLNEKPLVGQYQSRPFTFTKVPSWNGKSAGAFEVTDPGSSTFLSGSPYSSPCLCSGKPEVSAYLIVNIAINEFRCQFFGALFPLLTLSQVYWIYRLATEKQPQRPQRSKAHWSLYVYDMEVLWNQMLIIPTYQCLHIIK